MTWPQVFNHLIDAVFSWPVGLGFGVWLVSRLVLSGAIGALSSTARKEIRDNVFDAAARRR